MSIYRLSSIKLLAFEIITLAFRDLTKEEYKKNGKLSKVILKQKQSARYFLSSEWGEACAELAGIKNLETMVKKNPNGIKLNHFEITRLSRSKKLYKERILQNEA